MWPVESPFEITLLQCCGQSYWLYLLCGHRIMENRMCTIRAPSDAPSGIVQARADAVRAWKDHTISGAG